MRAHLFLGLSLIMTAGAAAQGADGIKGTWATVAQKSSGFGGGILMANRLQNKKSSCRLTV
jgi:hypothetical protein